MENGIYNSWDARVCVGHVGVFYVERRANCFTAKRKGHEDYENDTSNAKMFSRTCSDAWGAFGNARKRCFGGKRSFISPSRVLYKSPLVCPS